MKRGVVSLLALLLAACNMSVPQVTPTVRPTLTPSETPFLTATPPPTLTATRTQTPTLTLTDTPPPTATESPTSPPSETFTASFTPSQTPTGTPPPTDTPTLTLTPSDTATPTLTPTDTNTPTPTPTDTATDTPVPSATRTYTPSATFTPPPTATPPPSNTFTPSPTNTATTPPTPTPLPTLGATATYTPTVTPLPSRTFTPTPSATPVPPSLTPTGEGGFVPLGERPELTLVPVTPPTNTPGIPPTLDTTPTLVTAAPGTQVTIQVTPLEALTSTPLPTPPTLEVINPTPLPTLITADPSTFSFALSTTNGTLNSSAFSLPGDTTRFARNPVDPNRYVTVDTIGLLYLVNDLMGAGRERATFAPFNVDAPASAEQNSTNVVQVAWSPNGVYFAFLIDTDSDDVTQNDSSADGIWYVVPQRITEADPSYQLLRDCPPELGCDIVQRDDDTRWRSLRFEWNAQSSGILVTVQLPDENRQGFIVVDAVPDKNYSQVQPPIYRYDFASWAQDGNSIIVSGANPAGQVGVWRINRATGQEDMLFDGSSGGLWVQNAVERPGGQVVMLGSVGGAGGAMALYDTNATALTEPIGSAAPARVDWSPDHSAVLLVVPEGGVPRYYVAQVNGQVREITQAVAGALAVEWVQGQPPPSANPAAAVPPAAPTPTETTFAIGQTVSVVATQINLRPAPGINNEPVGVVNFGAALTIQGEPVSADGYRWYLVTTDDGRTGYVADAVNGMPSISS